MKLEKDKKYTLLAIGESMPACFRSEFQVKDIDSFDREICVHKGKRKRFTFRPEAFGKGSLVFEGWDIKPLLKSEVVVNGCRSFMIDGTICFAETTVDEVKALLKKNLNENFISYNRISISVDNNNVPLTELAPEMMQEITRAQRKLPVSA